MDRNESFAPLEIAALGIRLAWASLEVTVDPVPELQLMVTGDDADVEALRINVINGELRVEQPAMGVSRTMITGHWMDVRLRVPADWKGAIELSTNTGRLSARGLYGSDISVSSVTGDINVQQLQAITVQLSNVNGSIIGSNVACEQLTLHNVLGRNRMQELSALRISCNSVNSDLQLALCTPFDKLDARTVNGSLLLDAPVHTVNARYRTVTGKLRTWGVSLQDAGLPITMNTVSGDLEITAVPAADGDEA